MKKNVFLLVMLLAYCLPGLSQSQQSQTKTASRFNFNGMPYLNSWQQEGFQYVAADDDSYAYTKKITPNNGSPTLTLQDFNFEIPPGATVNDITVLVRRFKKGSSVTDFFATLLKSGFGYYNPTPNGVRWVDQTPYPGAEAPFTYFQSGSGNNGGLYGTTTYQWTPEMINDPAFGVRIDTNNPAKGWVVIYYDLVTITVSYTGADASPFAQNSSAAKETELLKTSIVYPNPFTAKTNIQFTAAETGSAVVELYNFWGGKIQTLFSGKVVKGQPYTIVTGEAQLAKGRYFYMIKNGDQKYTGRLIKME